MHRFAVAAAFFAVAIFALASGQLQLPCSSQLRLIYPQLFAHCDCHYSEWGEWVVDAASLVTVPMAQCPSGDALSETRFQIATGQNCADRTEKRSICKCKWVSTFWRFHDHHRLRHDQSFYFFVHSILMTFNVKALLLFLAFFPRPNKSTVVL